MSNRPKGPQYRITSTWQTRVNEELARRRWERQEFADRLGVVPATITNILRPGAGTSRHVPEINRLLDIAPPEYEDGYDQESHELTRKLRALDSKEYFRMLETLKRQVREIEAKTGKK